MGIQNQFILLVILFTTPIFGQYRKSWPMYSLQNMPQTKFSCHDKILGGYYADPETQCQMFHVCVKVAGVGVQDFRFLCPNSTAFDQEAQICADWGDVDCEQSVLYYGSDNFDLYRLGSGFESKRAPLAEEDEATFHLQRAETSDPRRADKQTQIDQRARPDQPPNYTRTFERNTQRSFFEANQRSTTTSDYKVTQKYVTTKKPFYSKPEGNNYYSTPRNNDYNFESRQDQDELFKGSHSSNFFSNRNNGKEDDFDYVKSPETSSKRPTGRRIRIKDSQRITNSNNIVSSSTKRATTQAPPTTQEPQKNRGQTLTLQTSFRAAGIQYDDQYYKPTTAASTTLAPTTASPTTSTTTTTTTTRAPSSTTQLVQHRYSFNSTDFQTQQKIQPTTYNPSSSAFRIKVTTSKYDEPSTTSRNNHDNFNRIVSRKSTTSKYDDVTTQKDNYEFFNRVSNRKVKPENNIVAQSLSQNKNIKNATSVNGRNQIDSERKNVQPIGFQTYGGTKNFNDFTNFDDIQKQQNRQPTKVPLNVRPLEPRRLNAALNTNQSSTIDKPETNNRNSNRYSTAQQLEPQYFRDSQQKIAYRDPAPFSKINSAQKAQVSGNGGDNTNNFADFRKTGTQQQKDVNSNYSAQKELSKDFNKLSVLTQQAAQQTFRNSPRSEYQKAVNSQRDYNTAQKLNFDNNTPSAPVQRPKKVFQGPKEDFSRSPQNAKKQEHLAVVDSLPRGFSSRGQIKHSGNQTVTETTQRSAQINYELRNQNRNNENYTPSSLKRFSTLVPRDQYYPTTFKPTTYRKEYESNLSQKPVKVFEATTLDRTTAITTRPTTTTIRTTRTTTTPTTTTTQFNLPLSNTNEPDEDDGQYHPELYEQNFPRNQIKIKQNQQEQSQTQKPFQNRQQTQQSRPQLRQQTISTSTDVSDEDELFKTAQSLNLGAAGLNKLRADKVKADKTTKQPSSPSAPAFFKQSYQSSTTPKANHLAKTTESKKQFSKKPPHADEDTSYDYAYYDSLSETPQEYSEYDVISEFAKTKKKQ